jgi:hypothetical protein
MRIDVDTVYVLENGELAHINLFFSGDESTPAHYQGAVEGHGLHNWKPNGDSMDDIEDWKILRKAAVGHEMIVHSTDGGIGSDDTA